MPKREEKIGYCPVCGVRVVLTETGIISNHNALPFYSTTTTCPGTGRKPAERKEPCSTK